MIDLDLDEIEKIYKGWLGTIIYRSPARQDSMTILKLIEEIKRLRADAKHELRKEGWLSDPESQSYFAEECVKDLKETAEELKRTRELLEECRSVMQFALNYAEQEYRLGDKGYQFAIYMRESLAKLRSVSPQGEKG